MEHRDLDASIRYLRGILPTEHGQVVESACQGNARRYPGSGRSTPKIDARPHAYGPDDTVICQGRFGGVVFAEMLKDGACSAPTLSRLPIGTGKIESLLPLDDMIVKLVDHHARTVYNVTLPKHILFPGYVKLVVRESAIDTFVSVSGEGSGNLMAANTAFGPTLFRTLLKHYLVPRVDRELERSGVRRR